MSTRVQISWLAALCCVAIAGCGLTLDYGPPDLVTMDAGRADAGPETCATGCDDGLRCTTDVCQADGTCTHPSTCPTGTDCIERGAGECRRPCTGGDECTDDVDCTDDVCDPADGHCAHPSNCQAPRVACLSTGVCAPDSCATDADCSDDNLCNGMERCVSGACRAGVPVVCEDPMATDCIGVVCDPHTGACGQVPNADHCDDGLDCTSDVCGTDGGCRHVPNDTLCANDDLCATVACRPDDPTRDTTGCAVVARRACTSPCVPHGTTLECTADTGLCEYASLCAAGQFCGPSGCEDVSTCMSDATCLDVIGHDGCSTVCSAGVCTSLDCVPRMGTCGALVADPDGCPGTSCNYRPVNEYCDDGDALSTDTCDPSTFTCTHTCPAPTTGDCVHYAYTTSCVQVNDSLACAALHPGGGSATNCARYTCVGHTTAGALADGCALTPIDSACGDTATCTTDTCVIDASSGTGSCMRAPDDTMCDDGQDCTIDHCDPANADTTSTSGCAHRPDDTVCATAAGTRGCARSFCAQTGALGNTIGGTSLPTGCAVEYMPAACGLLTNTICTLDGNCTMVRCGSGMPACDDGVSCNGVESCGLGHCNQTTLLVGRCATGAGCDSVCTPMGCVAPITPACGATAD